MKETTGNLLYSSLVKHGSFSSCHPCHHSFIMHVSSCHHSIVGNDSFSSRFIICSVTYSVYVYDLQIVSLGLLLGLNIPIYEFDIYLNQL